MKIGELKKTIFIDTEDIYKNNSSGIRFKINFIEDINNKKIYCEYYRLDMYNLNPMNNNGEHSNAELYTKDEYFEFSFMEFSNIDTALDFVLNEFKRKMG